MKIYEIGTGYTPIPAQISAATEIVVEELTKAFMKLDVPVEIVDIAADCRAKNTLPIREVKVPKSFSGTDVQLGIMHKLKRVVYSVALAGVLKRILVQAEEKVVLHFHNQYNLFFFYKLVPQKLQKKAVIAYTNHSGVWRLPWEEIESTINKRYFQEAVCMKKADVVFVLNQETKANIKTYLGVPEERIALIGNGVNTDVYHPLTEAEKQAAKAKWGLEGKSVILQVGSVYENKGQLRSLEYLLPLLKTNRDLVYVYAGGIVDTEYQKQIIRFVEENRITDNVRYLGMVKPGIELNSLYNSAELSIFPSQYEAFGLVVTEAFSAGIPVLINQHSNIRFGDGSLFFDSNCLSEVITQYISTNNQQRSELLKAARCNAVINYSWNRIASEYIRVLRDRMNRNV